MVAPILRRLEERVKEGTGLDVEMPHSLMICV